MYFTKTSHVLCNIVAQPVRAVGYFRGLCVSGLGMGNGGGGGGKALRGGVSGV